MPYLRILAGTVLGLAALWLALAWTFRQPNLGNYPYPDTSRADAARLEQHVRFLAAPGAWRNLRHAGAMARAADYIASQFSATSAEVSEQPYKAGPVETRNVVARARGPASRGGRGTTMSSETFPATMTTPAASRDSSSCPASSTGGTCRRRWS